MQNVLDAHDTPFRPSPRFGVGSIDQRDPFQCSASVVDRPAPFSTAPTAVQSVSEVHDTPLRSARPGRLARVEVLCTTNLDLFQRSARVTRPVSASMIVVPTMVHAVGDVHDTAESSSRGERVLVVFHVDPFQRYAWSVVMAEQAPAATHDTLTNGSSPGLRWITQALPVHRSTREAVAMPPSDSQLHSLVDSPTAVQSVAELHETSLSALEFVLPRPKL